MELFGRGLQNRLNRGIIKLPKMPHSLPNIKSLLFADDVLLFCRATRRSLSEIASVLGQLERCAGLKINGRKSSIFMFGVSDSKAIVLSSILEWKTDKLPSKYLGLPLFVGKMKEDHCTDLIGRLERKKAAWQTNFLSFAGRLCLVKHNLVISGVYWMQGILGASSLLRSQGKVLGHGSALAGDGY
ncbi:hypothetical protein EJ110_NYTH39283 [Nymphaea thermarum]|nr:hypothetical protein EJ110_NYTH39283 [Nymphaea thermarum]